MKRLVNNRKVREKQLLTIFERFMEEEEELAPENVAEWEQMLQASEIGTHGTKTDLIDIEALVGKSDTLDYSYAIDIYNLGGAIKPMVVKYFTKDYKEYYKVYRGHDTLAAVRWLHQQDDNFEMIRCVVCKNDHELHLACKQYDR